MRILLIALVTIFGLLGCTSPQYHGRAINQSDNTASSSSQHNKSGVTLYGTVDGGYGYSERTTRTTSNQD